MARANKTLIHNLRKAADNISRGADYNWGHVGKCNCGHLLQAISPMNSAEIYNKAQNKRLDEWTEYANDYCSVTGADVDDMLEILLDAGLELKDISELEYLSNEKVLDSLPGGFRYLEKGKREDAAVYMDTWAEVLETEMA